MKSVYILLVRTNTVFSRVIHKMTDAQYTHAALALDRHLNRMYSFARRHEYFPFIAGFIHENLYRGVYAKNKNAPCALYELKIPEKSYVEIADKITEMLYDYDKYHYNFLGTITNLFQIGYRRRYHYFCSQFVAQMLDKTGVIQFPKDTLLMRPMDFARLPELKEVYKGTLGDLIRFTSRMVTVIPRAQTYQQPLIS